MIKTEVLPHKILGVEFAPFFIPIARRLQVRKYITSLYKSLCVNFGFFIQFRTTKFSNNTIAHHFRLWQWFIGYWDLQS